MSTQETEPISQAIDESLQQDILKTASQNMSDEEIENYLRTMSMDELYRFDMIMDAVLENNLTSESEEEDRDPSENLPPEPEQQTEASSAEEIKSDE